MSHPDDQSFMLLALEEARSCMEHGDVPIGAVVVRDGQVIAKAGNERELDQDPTAHAEILALRRASEVVGSWRLEGCTLYVTLEPCAMCAGAVVLSRLDTLVWGATDPKAGYCGSLGDITADTRLNHAVQTRSGVLADECSGLLKDFFAAKRRPAADTTQSGQ